MNQFEYIKERMIYSEPIKEELNTWPHFQVGSDEDKAP